MGSARLASWFPMWSRSPARGPRSPHRRRTGTRPRSRPVSPPRRPRTPGDGRPRRPRSPGDQRPIAQSELLASETTGQVESRRSIGRRDGSTTQRQQDARLTASRTDPGHSMADPPRSRTDTARDPPTGSVEHEVVRMGDIVDPRAGGPSPITCTSSSTPVALGEPNGPRPTMAIRTKQVTFLHYPVNIEQRTGRPIGSSLRALPEPSSAHFRARLYLSPLLPLPPDHRFAVRCSRLRASSCTQVRARRPGLLSSVPSAPECAHHVGRAFITTVTVTTMPRCVTAYVHSRPILAPDITCPNAQLRAAPMLSLSTSARSWMKAAIAKACDHRVGFHSLRRPRWPRCETRSRS